MPTFMNQVTLELLYDSISDAVQVVLHVFDELGTPVKKFCSPAKSNASIYAPAEVSVSPATLQLAQICTEKCMDISGEFQEGRSTSCAGKVQDSRAPRWSATSLTDLSIEGRGELLRTVAQLLQQLADKEGSLPQDTSAGGLKETISKSEPWGQEDVERLLTLELEIIRLQQALQVLQVEFEARASMAGVLETRLQETHTELKASEQRSSRLADTVQQLQNDIVVLETGKAALQQQLRVAQIRIQDLEAERAHTEKGASYPQQQARQQLSHLKKENQQLKAQISAACGNLKAMGIPSSKVFSRGVTAHVQLASPPDSPSGAPTTDRSGGSDVAYIDFRPPAAKIRQRPPMVPRLQLSDIAQQPLMPQEGPPNPQASLAALHPGAPAREAPEHGNAVQRSPRPGTHAVPAEMQHGEGMQPHCMHVGQQAQQQQQQQQSHQHTEQQVGTASATTSGAPGSHASLHAAVSAHVHREEPLPAGASSGELVQEGPQDSAAAATSCEPRPTAPGLTMGPHPAADVHPAEQQASPHILSTWQRMILDEDAATAAPAAPAGHSVAGEPEINAWQGASHPAVEPLARPGPGPATVRLQSALAKLPSTHAEHVVGGAAAAAVCAVPAQQAGKALKGSGARSEECRGGELIGAWQPPPHEGHPPSHTRRSYASFSGSCTPAPKLEPPRPERAPPKPQRVTYAQLPGFQEVRAAYQAVVASEEGTEARWAQRLSSRSAVETSPAKIEPIVQGLVQLFGENGVCVPLKRTGPCQYSLGPSAKMVVRLVNGRLMARSGSSNVDVIAWLAKQPVQRR